MASSEAPSLFLEAAEAEAIVGDLVDALRSGAPWPFAAPGAAGGALDDANPWSAAPPAETQRAATLKAVVG